MTIYELTKLKNELIGDLALCKSTLSYDYTLSEVETVQEIIDHMKEKEEASWDLTLRPE